LQNNTTTTTTTLASLPIDPQRYQQLVRKLDLEDMMSSESGRAEKKPPTLDELRKTAAENQYELKVKEFYFGKEVRSKEEVRNIYKIIYDIHHLFNRKHQHHL
jgi:hypothetical protein